MAATAAGGVGGTCCGSGKSLGFGRQGALDRPINSSTMTGPDATVAVSRTVSPAAEDTQISFLTSKVDAGHPHLTMGSGAWIDRSTPLESRAAAGVALRMARLYGPGTPPPLSQAGVIPLLLWSRRPRRLQ